MNCFLRKEFINKNVKIIMKSLLMVIYIYFLYFIRSRLNFVVFGFDFVVVNLYIIDIL